MDEIFSLKTAFSVAVGLTAGFGFEGLFNLPFWHFGPGQTLATKAAQFWGFLPSAGAASQTLMSAAAPAAGLAGTALDMM